MKRIEITSSIAAVLSVIAIGSLGLAAVAAIRLRKSMMLLSRCQGNLMPSLEEPLEIDKELLSCLKDKVKNIQIEDDKTENKAIGGDKVEEDIL